MGSLNTNLNVGRDTRSATARDVDAGPSQPSKKTEENAVASRPWAEFRLAVVGHLAFRELEPGSLRQS
jgi:hypothetical protein